MFDCGLKWQFSKINHPIKLSNALQVRVFVMSKNPIKSCPLSGFSDTHATSHLIHAVNTPRDTLSQHKQYSTLQHCLMDFPSVLWIKLMSQFQMLRVSQVIIQWIK